MEKYLKYKMHFKKPILGKETSVIYDVHVQDTKKTLQNLREAVESALILPVVQQWCSHMIADKHLSGAQKQTAAS